MHVSRNPCWEECRRVLEDNWSEIVSRTMDLETLMMRCVFFRTGIFDRNKWPLLMDWQICEAFVIIRTYLQKNIFLVHLFPRASHGIWNGGGRTGHAAKMKSTNRGCHDQLQLSALARLLHFDFHSYFISIDCIPIFHHRLEMSLDLSRSNFEMIKTKTS